MYVIILVEIVVAAGIVESDSKQFRVVDPNQTTHKRNAFSLAPRNPSRKWRSQVIVTLWQRSVAVAILTQCLLSEQVQTKRRQLQRINGKAQITNQRGNKQRTPQASLRSGIGRRSNLPATGCGDVPVLA
eukprot:3010268-Amphidinium_carterae.2